MHLNLEDYEIILLVFFYEQRRWEIIASSVYLSNLSCIRSKHKILSVTTQCVYHTSDEHISE